MRRVRFGRVFGFLGSLLYWGLAIWCIVLLSGSVRTRFDSQKVTSVEVDVVDSSRHNNLITSQMVLDMIVPSKIVDKSVRDVDLTELERRVAKNGFIENVKIYYDYNGRMCVEVSQRRALARLLLDGYNCYINSDGVIFPAPRTTVLYAQAVSGNYPLFVPRDYMGSVDDYMLERISQIEDQIEEIERDRYPVLMRKSKNYDNWRDLRKQYTSRRTFESRESYVKRYTELKYANQRKRELYSYEQRQIERDMAAIDAKVAKKRDEQLRIIERCDDIHNLITLLELLENDRYWSKEVVQVIVDEGERGEMRVSMSMRSGRFNVTLGELLADYSEVVRNSLDAMATIGEQQQRVAEGSTTSMKSERRVISHYRTVQRRLVRRNIFAKLERVEYFYDEVLERVGWELYRDINVEFENQIVCRK